MHEDPIVKPRRRQHTYTAQFKAELVAQCMDPNVLRRWVIEHERLGLLELDASVDTGEMVEVLEPTSWLPFVPVQTTRPAAPIALTEPVRPLSSAQSPATIEVDPVAGRLSMKIH